MTNRIKPLLAVTLALTMIILSAFTVIAAGTNENTLMISTADELYGLAEAVNGGSAQNKVYTLGDNITVNDDFVPIGTAEHPFGGTFDGKGYAISGVSADRDYAGLFGVTDGATIKNVEVKLSGINGTEAAGGIVALAKNSTVTNCKVSSFGASTVYIGCTDNNAGGVAGIADKTNITGCSTTSAVNISAYQNAGGIAGSATGNISDCKNASIVTADKYVGGIAGRTSGDITGCTNTAAVKVFDSVGGGIAGHTSGKTELCSNTGTVSAATSLSFDVGRLGGIAGVCHNAQITLCYNLGEVKASGNYAAGIAAVTTGGSITNSYNAGIVSATDGIYAGGVFGSTSGTSVMYCYNAAAVTGDSFGGIGGSVNGAVKNCYTGDEVSKKFVVGATVPEGTAILTPDEMKTDAAFVGFDFDNIWTFDTVTSADGNTSARHGYSYPVLKAINYHTFPAEAIITELTCTQDAMQIFTCMDPGCMEEVSYIIEAAPGHKMVKTAGNAATCTENGFEEFSCSVCGYATHKDSDALGHIDIDNNKICDRCDTKLEGYVEPEEQPKDEELNLLQRIIKKISEILNSIIEFFNKFLSFIKFN